MSKLAHSNQETMDEIERNAKSLDEPTTSPDDTKQGTPLVDAASVFLCECAQGYVECVSSVFARQLERALAAAEKRVRELESAGLFNYGKHQKCWICDSCGKRIAIYEMVFVNNKPFCKEHDPELDSSALKDE